MLGFRGKKSKYQAAGWIKATFGKLHNYLGKDE
jgi:hypothetical protein